jgi:hypothetical protein
MISERLIDGPIPSASRQSISTAAPQLSDVQPDRPADARHRDGAAVALKQRIGDAPAANQWSLLQWDSSRLGSPFSSGKRSVC